MDRGRASHLKQTVQAAIASGITARRRILRELTEQQRQDLLRDLFLDLFGKQHVLLQKWGALTGQSAQVDTGYIAQFVASIMLREPGQGFRGKGDDLADGSEVKGAANISGVDRPRWNHNLGTPAEDDERRGKGLPTKAEEYLSSPYVFYLLADRPVVSERPLPILIRCWCLDGKRDEAWRALVTNFLDQRKPKQYNLQLHPPVGYDDDEVVNTLGNIDFSAVKCLDARVDVSDPNVPVLAWTLAPLPAAELGLGRASAKPYVTRPSRLTDADDIVADLATLPMLFPEIMDAADAAQVVAAAAHEVASE